MDTDMEVHTSIHVGSMYLGKYIRYYVYVSGS